MIWSYSCDMMTPCRMDRKISKLIDVPLFYFPSIVPVNEIFRANVFINSEDIHTISFVTKSGRQLLPERSYNWTAPSHALTGRHVTRNFPTVKQTNQLKNITINSKKPRFRITKPYSSWCLQYFNIWQLRFSQGFKLVITLYFHRKLNVIMRH